jgi:predicted transcriptional regulator
MNIRAVRNIYVFHGPSGGMGETDATERWRADKTTFQRVYDLLVGKRTFSTAGEFAEQADCSETGARNALEQLSEMGIADRRDGRPATYRRNDSYFEWKRVERLADEYSNADLQERIETLIAEDRAFQEEFGVPEPAAVSVADVPVDDHETLQDRWEAQTEWRTVRRDIRLLRRAVERTETGVDDGATP